MGIDHDGFETLACWKPFNRPSKNQKSSAVSEKYKAE
jgi:hypothetical protein